MRWITMDGNVYHVRIAYESITEQFDLIEGKNAGDMMNGLHTRDLIGTYLTHTLQVEMDPDYPDDYDRFWGAIRAPVSYHTITMPNEQSTITYKAMVETGNRTYRGVVNGRKRYSPATITFSSIEPVFPAEGVS